MNNVAEEKKRNLTENRAADSTGTSVVRIDEVHLPS
jgi:hypothetical protein